MSLSEFSLTTKDNLELYACAWQPAETPRAVVVLLHGLGEHCHRYDHVARALNQAGLALMAFDLRGHGRSPGARGHIPSFDTVYADLELLLAEAERRFPGAPRFLYGHSLGATLALAFTLQRKPGLAGVIATGPQLRLAFEPPKWKTLLGRLLYNAMPTMIMPNGLEQPALSRDPAVVQAYRDDPLVHDKISVRLGIELLDSGLWLLAHADELTIPLLLMHGGADRLTSVEASQEFASHTRPGLCDLIVWDGFYHEIHNEPEKEQVFAAMLHWLEQRLKA